MQQEVVMSWSLWLVETLSAHTHVHVLQVHWYEPFGSTPRKQKTHQNKIMGLNQYLDRMNTKTSFILILGCIGVMIGIAPNRKSAMESRLNHAKMLFWHGGPPFCSIVVYVSWNQDFRKSTYFFSFAGRKASISIFQALRPERCGLTEKWNTFLFCISGRKAWNAYWNPRP